MQAKVHVADELAVLGPQGPLANRSRPTMSWRTGSVRWAASSQVSPIKVWGVVRGDVLVYRGGRDADHVASVHVSDPAFSDAPRHEPQGDVAMLGRLLASEQVFVLVQLILHVVLWRRVAYMRTIRSEQALSADESWLLRRTAGGCEKFWTGRLGK